MRKPGEFGAVISWKCAHLTHPLPHFNYLEHSRRSHLLQQQTGSL